MSFAPKTNWASFEALTRDSDRAWIRGLTEETRFASYSALFNALWKSRSGPHATPGDWERLNQWSWKQKLAERHRMWAAFSKRDEYLRERTASRNSF